MLNINEDNQKNIYDFDEINNDIVQINSSGINVQPHKDENSEILPAKTKLTFFLVGFSYTGLLVLSIFWAILLAFFSDDKSFISICVQSFTYISLLAIFVFIARKSKKYFINELKNVENYIHGIAFGFIAIAAEIAVNLLVQTFFPSEVNGNQAAVVDLFTNYPTIMFFVTVFVGPLCEEITYRVGLFGLIKEKNETLALIVASFVFAFVHMSFTDTTFVAEITSFPTYLVIGFVLTYAYKKYGLPCSFIAHLIINLISVLGIMLA